MTRGSLILYTLPHCPKCKILERYLNSKNIPYEERNAQDFADFLMSKGFFTAPVLELNGEFYNFTSVNSLIFLLREKGLLSEDSN